MRCIRYCSSLEFEFVSSSQVHVHVHMNDAPPDLSCVCNRTYTCNNTSKFKNSVI